MTELQLALSELKPTATGEDNIHNSMLQNAPQQFLELILYFYNRIWETGNYPASWKTATIIPLLKAHKDKIAITSYRPISLTSCLAKLLERMVNRRLIWRLESDNLLNRNQYGFRPQRDTIDALLQFTESIYKGFKTKSTTIAVAIDFDAAFDSVPPKSVILQTMKLGIKGKLLQFICSFLNNRKIQTCINNTLSNIKTIENGIPQGSVISPVLFNIMLHDLSLQIPPGVQISIYADDITIWSTHRNHNVATQYIQIAIDNISKWSSKWSLKISESKTEFCVFTRRHSLREYEPVILLHGAPITYNKHLKILGVTLDPKLLWNQHVIKTTEQCTKRLNLLKMVASQHWGADTITLRQFYVSYIRSKLTYGCEIWGGAANSHIYKLSIIQNAALRLCLGCPRTTAISALEIEINIEPLTIYISNRLGFRFLRYRALRKTSHPGHELQQNEALPYQSFGYRISQQTYISELNFPATILCYNPIPPWEWNQPIINTTLSNLKKSDNELLLKSTFMEIKEEYHNYNHIYTDGSLSKIDNESGAAYFVEQTGEDYLIPSNSISSMEAELCAIHAALQYCKVLRKQIL